MAVKVTWSEWGGIYHPQKIYVSEYIVYGTVVYILRECTYSWIFVWIRNLLIYMYCTLRTLKKRYENIHIKAQTHEISVLLVEKKNKI